jgi:cysteine desulfurase
MVSPIYLDHHATTPVDPRVLEAMLPYFCEAFGNASSRGHAWGRRAAAAVEDARERIAMAIGAADPSEILFTSGTTESNNLALKGVAQARRAHRNRLVTTQIEHHAVLEPCRALEAEGLALVELAVDADGRIDGADLEAALTPQTALVSIAAANGEVGTLQPLADLADRCHAQDVLLHTDAAQAVGRVPFDVREAGVDLCSFCAHKLYGPKGVGALYVRSGRPRVRIAPLLHGGGQERGLRSGTLPVPLIVGFARALEISVSELAAEAARLTALADQLHRALEKQVAGMCCNGPRSGRLPGNLNVSFEGVDAAAVVGNLPGIALSTGSACASGRSEPSHVLTALGLPPARARSAIRFGIGRGNTREEIDTVARAVADAVHAHRRQRGWRGSSAPSPE